MPRVIKEPAVRRSEILETAQKLIYTKGYEQMTIQDIIDDLQISKGAFYHYFTSKADLLEAIAERLTDEAIKILQPIADDPNLPAVEKFDLYFANAVGWKTAQKDFLLALLRAWYQDENLRVRQKVTVSGFTRLVPVILSIVEQGRREGVFDPPFPDQVGQLIFAIMTGLAEAVAEIWLTGVPDASVLPKMERLLGAYTDAFECILRAKPGSLKLADMEAIRKWISAPAPVETN